MTSPTPSPTRRGPVGALPKFAEPTPPPATEPPAAPPSSPDPSPSTPAPSDAMSRPTEGPRPAEATTGSRRLLDALRPGTGDTRTRISAGTGDEPPPVRIDKATAVAAMVGAVGVAVTLAGVLVRLRYKGARTLREPTKEQSGDIARPLASLMMRHASMAKTLPDLIDVLSTIGATGSYLNDGPLTKSVRGDQGAMPQLDEEIR